MLLKETFKLNFQNLRGLKSFTLHFDGADYLYTVKTLGRKNYIIMTKNPNPNIILTYINMPREKNPDFRECCVFKNYDRESV